MSDLLLTAALAMVFILLALAGMGIGLILRGKPLQKNCGKPVDPKTGDCQGDKRSCEICGNGKAED